MGDWLDAIYRRLNVGRIVNQLYRSKEGLTFTDLLKQSKLSRPVLTDHLRRLTSKKVVVQEGVGRDRKYKVHPELAELLQRVGEEAYADILLEVIRDSIPSKAKAEFWKGEKFAKFWKNIEERVQP